MGKDFVSTVLAILMNLIANESDLLHSGIGYTGKLVKDLSEIASVLEDAEQKQLGGSSRAIDDWMQNLMDAVYLLDDILDERSTEAIRDSYEGVRSCAFLSAFNPRNIKNRRSINAKMKAVCEKLDFISKAKNHFNFTPAAATEGQEYQRLPAERSRRTLAVTYNCIYGRELDMEMIVRLLKDDYEVNDLQVVAIVGMGGIGKTTLAELVFNDDSVNKHFDRKFWICVTENFHLRTLIKSIIESATGTKFSYESYDHLEYLAEELRAILGGERYLLVLDDLWIEDEEQCKQLKMLLACGSKGSAILVTTRLEKIAYNMGASRPYLLTVLSGEDCWEVFKGYAFRFQEEDTQGVLLSIGMQIATKSIGVPFSAKILGSLLSQNYDIEWWLHVMDSLRATDDESIICAMKLSYLNLSPRLRRCFVYLAIFPNNYNIEKEGLIHLWMANGLISCDGTGLEMEEIGDAMVNELYLKSLIQEIERDEVGAIRSFKMHDLVRCFAQSIAGDSVYVLDRSTSIALFPRTRHVSINYASEVRSSSHLVENVENVESLRTLINLSLGNSAVMFASFLEQTRLRALDLSMVAHLRELPSSVCLLKHLRYLNLSRTQLETLPDFICSLWNLQVLNLNWCRDLQKLPKSMGRLRNLRHLYLTDCWSLTSMPPNMGRLSLLRTLTLAIVGFHQGLDFQLSDLGGFHHLSGSLTIERLERVRDVKQALEANLVNKAKLQVLELKWGRSDDERLTGYKQQQEKILEALRPTQNLRELVVSGYKGLSFPQWMMNDIASFQHIHSLSLIFCRNCSRLPPFWRLPCLKKLWLEDLENLECLIECEEAQGENSENFTFKSLERLTIYRLPKLISIITRVEAERKMSGIFPSLFHLIIYRTKLSYSTLSYLGSLPSVRHFSMTEV